MVVILKQPILTEKSMQLAKASVFTFLVDKNASKEMIARTIKRQFNVNVVSVKIVNLKAETKRQRGGKGYFTQSADKKALVRVKKGQTIVYFQPEEGQRQEAEVKTIEGEVVGKVKEKKNILKGTKVKIEKVKVGE